MVVAFSLIGVKNAQFALSMLLYESGCWSNMGMSRDLPSLEGGSQPLRRPPRMV